jgi:hypothetical protein
MHSEFSTNSINENVTHFQKRKFWWKRNGKFYTFFVPSVLLLVGCLDMLVVDYPTPSKIDLGHVLNIFQLIFLAFFSFLRSGSFLLAYYLTFVATFTFCFYTGLSMSSSFCSCWFNQTKKVWGREDEQK